MGFVLAGFLGTPAQVQAAASAERFGELAVLAAQKQYDLYKTPAPVGGGYGDFGAYDGYVLKKAGADLTLWKQGDVSLEDQLRALMDQTIRNPGTVSAKEAAYEFLAAQAIGDAVREAALLQILIDRQIREGDGKGALDSNMYSDAPAFEALARGGVLDRMQAADAYAYLLRNWDEASGAWPQGYVDLMTTAQTLRALSSLAVCAPEAVSETDAGRIAAGMAWLEACQQPDGGFLGGDGDDPLVDTAEVLLTLSGDAALELDSWNRDGVGAADYIADSALSAEGVFGTLGNAADHSAALEALICLGAAVDWRQVNISGGGGNEGGEGGGETPGAVAAVSLEITGPSGRVLYERNTVRVGADAPNPLEALKQSGLPYRLKGDDFVEEIGGYANSGSNGWMYQVNGVRPTLTILEYRLKDGDSLLWFYSEDPGNIAGIENASGGGVGGGAPAPTPTPVPSPSPTPAAGYKTQIVLTIGNTEAQVNGETQSMDVPASVIESRTMAPLRFVAEAMGAEISWLEASKEVVIERGQGSVPAASSLETKADAAVRQVLQSYQGRDQLSLWEGMALASRDVTVPPGVTETLLKEFQSQQGKWLATDYAKAILFLKSVGQDPKSFGGYNLTEKLYNLSDLDRQGVNGLIWALNALESEELPADAVWTRERLWPAILTYQNQDGGFALSQGADSDVDVTAMAMAALAGWDHAYVDQALLRGMAYLIQAQSEDGEFSSMGAKNSGSVSQVILTLCKLDISPLDARFVKQGKTLADILLSYQADDGRFRHTHDGQSNDMATEQAVQALIQYGKLAAEQNGPRVVLKVRPNALNPDMTPVIADGRVLVPVRYVTEKLGAEVQWDPAARTVTISKR
jgi:prenyltransferase beta subunit